MYFLLKFFSVFFPVFANLDNDNSAYFQNVLEWKKQIIPLSGCFRCAAWVGFNADDRMQKYCINYIGTSQSTAVVIVLSQKSSVLARPKMKEPLTENAGYQVINLQNEHTLRHKHCFSMWSEINAIMNDAVRSSYIYLVTVTIRKGCTFVVNGMFSDATYWKYFFLDIYQYMIFSCILQNGYEKLDEAYIHGILRKVILIGASKFGN